MVYNILKAQNRGRTKISWLDSYHSFSFGNYYSPEYTSHGSLRVFNDDFISANSGFGMHPHSNMEIVTIVLSGDLKHFDSIGNEGNLRSGIVQAMSAGTGIVHSEINPSKSNSLELFQIWIKPKTLNLSPSYTQKEYILKKNEPCEIVSKNGIISINQDTRMILLDFDKSKTFNYNVEFGNIYLIVIDGEVELFNSKLSKRDSMIISKENVLQITFAKDSRVLIIDTI